MFKRLNNTSDLKLELNKHLLRNLSSIHIYNLQTLITSKIIND